MSKAKNSQKKKMRDVVRNNLAWFILIFIVIIFSIISPNFISVGNLINILSQNAYVVVASLGIACIMMSGAMDLSVGYQMSLGNVLCATMMVVWGFPIWIAIIATILMCIAANLFNTLLSIKLKLPLFIVSLATMTVFQGVSYVFSKSRSINGFSDEFKVIGQGSVGGIPISIIIMVVFFLMMSFILNRTYIGRYVYALGGNEEASRLAGINVKKMKFFIAVAAGFFVGVATIMLLSRIGTGQSGLGPGTEFTVICGILLGGVSIRGGEGKLSGVVAGILIIAILSNGMQLAGLDIYYQYIAKGIIMLTAIGIDVYQLNRRQMEKKSRLIKGRQL